MSRRLWSEHLAAGAAPRQAPRPTAQDPARTVRPRGAKASHQAQAAPLRSGPVPAIQVVELTLMGKPRMTRRDRWQKRPCVLRYRAQTDELRLRGVVLPETYALFCYFPMPASWSAARKAAANGSPHRVKPDRDNVEKALMDGLCPRDQVLHKAFVSKVWAYSGRFVLADLKHVEDLEALAAAHLPPRPE